MSDTVTITTTLLFWTVFGSMVLGAVIAWAAVWGYWKAYADERVRDARQQYRSDQAELRNARIVERVHDGLSLQDWIEL